MRKASPDRPVRYRFFLSLPALLFFLSLTIHLADIRWSASLLMLWSENDERFFFFSLSFVWQHSFCSSLIRFQANCKLFCLFSLWCHVTRFLFILQRAIEWERNWESPKKKQDSITHCKISETKINSACSSLWDYDKNKKITFSKKSIPL